MPDDLRGHPAKCLPQVLLLLHRRCLLWILRLGLIIASSLLRRAIVGLLLSRLRRWLVVGLLSSLVALSIWLLWLLLPGRR